MNVVARAGSDHTLNLEPCIPSLNAAYGNLLPQVTMGSRGKGHYENLWASLASLCGDEEVRGASSVIGTSCG